MRLYQVQIHHRYGCTSSERACRVQKAVVQLVLVPVLGNAIAASLLVLVLLLVPLLLLLLLVAVLHCA